MTDRPHTPPPPRRVERLHEAPDISVRGVLVAIAALAASLALAVVASHGLMRFYGWPVEHATPVAPPPVTLRVSPIEDRVAYQRAKEAELNRYGWNDRKNNIARIPIDRAMTLLAAEARDSGS